MYNSQSWTTFSHSFFLCSLHRKNKKSILGRGVLEARKDFYERARAHTGAEEALLCKNSEYSNFPSD